MAAAVLVPPGLADLPPGPELGVLLAGIDVSRVPNARILDVLKAESRQLAHQQARLFAAMAEVGRCESPESPGAVARAAEPLPEAIHEIGPALAVTTGSAFAEHDLAEQLRVRLPAVAAALRAGRIDRPKARLFVEHARELSPAQIARLCAELLPTASAWTTGQLGDRLRKWCLSLLDPDVLRRRYQKAVRERAVSGYLNRDGTATISASGLSPTEAAASCERVFELARAIRRAGHPDRLSRIRADLFLALLDGSLQQMTNDEVIAAMLARREAQETGLSEPDAGDGDGDESPAPQPAPPHTPEPETTPQPAPAPEPAPVPAPPEEARAGVEVRLRLSTLLGLDEQPAEIPGWGAIPPGPARELVARQRGGQWRFAITDAEGYLLLAGTTRRRPALADTAQADIAQAAGGVVELQVPLELLHRLAAEPAPGWQPLIADLAAQYAHRDQLQAVLNAFPGARFPHTALRRHIEVRDRTCVFPGCRRPARQVQQDHTMEYQHGGATVESNLGALCITHHGLKSAGGWRLDQPAPGRFTWHSPLRRTYRTRGEPIAPPLPEPILGDPDPENLDDGPDPRVTDRDDPPNFHPPTHPGERPPPQPPPDPHDEPPF